jgi:hypothetical protein
MTDEEATEYVEGAVSEMRGSYHPDSREFGFDPDSVDACDLAARPARETIAEVIAKAFTEEVFG